MSSKCSGFSAFHSNTQYSYEKSVTLPNTSKFMTYAICNACARLSAASSNSDAAKRAFPTANNSSQRLKIFK